MHSNIQIRDFGRCTVCGGKFGLVRYYSWQTAICSKKCAGRVKARRESDRRWLMHAMPIATPPGFSPRPLDGFERYRATPSLNL
jgi:hypothetical protein